MEKRGKEQRTEWENDRKINGKAGKPRKNEESTAKGSNLAGKSEGNERKKSVYEMKIVGILG